MEGFIPEILFSEFLNFNLSNFNRSTLCNAENNLSEGHLTLKFSWLRKKISKVDLLMLFMSVRHKSFLCNNFKKMYRAQNIFFGVYSFY